MTKFSVGIVDGEGPSNRAPPRKRPRNSDVSSDEDILPKRRNPPWTYDYEESEPEPEPELEPEGEEESEHEGESEESEEEEGEEEEEEESGAEQAAMSPEISRDDSISFTLTDPEVLDCPICCVALTLPVFQVGLFI